MPQNIENVVFDLGRVMVEWEPWSVVQAFTSDAAERALIWEHIFGHAIWLDLDRGDLTEAEATPLLSERTGLARDRIATLLAMIKASLHPVSESHVLLDEVVALGLNRYCLSNMSHDTYASLRDRYTFFQHFHGIMISAEVRINKPEPAIFKLLVERFELEAERTLFIDDSEANVVEARRHGIDAVLFDRSEACFRTIRERLNLT